MGKEIKDLLSRRWNMLSNPHVSPMRSMSPMVEGEVMIHCLMIDRLFVKAGEPYLTSAEMRQCYIRFRVFCLTQWENRN